MLCKQVEIYFYGGGSHNWTQNISYSARHGCQGNDWMCIILFKISSVGKSLVKEVVVGCTCFGARVMHV
jgi:hypothetical protein